MCVKPDAATRAMMVCVHMRIVIVWGRQQDLTPHMSLKPSSVTRAALRAEAAGRSTCTHHELEIEFLNFDASALQSAVSELVGSELAGSDPEL